jgi:hypothetical protein
MSSCRRNCKQEIKFLYSLKEKLLAAKLLQIYRRKGESLDGVRSEPKPITGRNGFVLQELRSTKGIP